MADAIEKIRKQAEALEDKKNKVTSIVDGLAAIAEENAANTEETSAATTEVAESFNGVTTSANELKKVAYGIAETMGTFHLDDIQN